MPRLPMSVFSMRGWRLASCAFCLADGFPSALASASERVGLSCRRYHHRPRAPAPLDLPSPRGSRGAAFGLGLRRPRRGYCGGTRRWRRGRRRSRLGFAGRASDRAPPAGQAIAAALRLARSRFRLLRGGPGSGFARRYAAGRLPVQRWRSCSCVRLRCAPRWRSRDRGRVGGGRAAVAGNNLLDVAAPVALPRGGKLSVSLARDWRGGARLRLTSAAVRSDAGRPSHIAAPRSAMARVCCLSF